MSVVSRGPRGAIRRHPFAWALLASTLALGGCLPEDVCPEGFVECGEACVDVSRDRQHCGECFVACGTGLVCDGAGECSFTCQEGLLACDGSCIDPMTSRDYCGASADCTGDGAGVACGASELCVGGACDTTCQRGFVACGDTCIDPMSNRSFCGASADCVGANAGVTCGTGQVCAGGACAPNCQAGLIACDGTCIDPQSSRSWCGATGACVGDEAGVACAPGQVCSLGECTVECGAGLVECDGNCIDPDTNKRYCSADRDCRGLHAGAECSAGTVCAAGRCAETCTPGLVVCDGRCADPLTDNVFCGARGDCRGEDAGTVCAPGFLCSGGSCVQSCGAGTIACGGRCIDPLTNNTFCGASADCLDANAGATCNSGTLCSGGTCELSCARGWIECDGVCTDPMISRRYCGATAGCTGADAGAVCDAGLGCRDGECESVACRSEQVLCDGVCVDPFSNPDHCGATGDCAGTNAGVACPAGHGCYAGSCIEPGASRIAPVYLKASNTDLRDRFGTAVAFDGGTLAVGAPREDTAAMGVGGDQDDSCERTTGPSNCSRDSGAVYIYSAASWTLEAYVKAPDNEPSEWYLGDNFGHSVALSGDTLVVGAPEESSAGQGTYEWCADLGPSSFNCAHDSGAAFVFTRTGATWTHQASIKASNVQEYDRFGDVVAVDGDTLAIGTDEEDSDATGIDGDQTNNRAWSSGAVYVRTRSGTRWSQQAYIKASNTERRDLFASSIALSGDTLVVGARGEDSDATGVGGDQTDNSALGSGAVYVFTRTGTTWTQQAYIKASNPDAGDGFGSSVALDGDTLVVGAPWEDSDATGVGGDQTDNSASGSGAVYVFTRTGATWTQQAYLKASNPGAGDRFGSSVTLDGDSLVVGAPFEDSNATGVDGDEANNGAVDTGAVYLFTRTGTVWSQEAYIKASSTTTEDEFGMCVALDEDVLAVGAPFEDSNATGVNGNQSDNSSTDSGAVFISLVDP